MWLTLKETAHHYWHGSKLLAADIRIAARLLGRVATARSLSRREHNLLVRVCADIARIVPLAFFVLVPMMEFALPFALKLFPGLLPSTFAEAHLKEEQRKKLLKVRMEMAQLMQHTLDERAAQVTREERARERRKSAEAVSDGGEPAVPQRETSLMNQDVREFMLRMKEGGRAASSEELVKMMCGFKDNVTLDHLYRDQLVAMAQFLGMNHFAPTPLLRYSLRQRLRKLRNEDKDILWEGVHSLSDKELVTDLRHRGLPTAHMDAIEMREALENWLKLSQVRELPYSLLIMTNMLHFAGTRKDLKERYRLGAEAEADMDLVAAQAALSSLPTEMAANSTLVEEMKNDEKLESIYREEKLIEEERMVQDSEAEHETTPKTVDEEEEEELREAARDGQLGGMSEAEEEVAGKRRLTREQVADLAEAMDTMIDSPSRRSVLRWRCSRRSDTPLGSTYRRRRAALSRWRCSTRG